LKTSSSTFTEGAFSSESGYPQYIDLSSSPLSFGLNGASTFFYKIFSQLTLAKNGCFLISFMSLFPNLAAGSSTNNFSIKFLQSGSKSSSNSNF